MHFSRLYFLAFLAIVPCELCAIRPLREIFPSYLHFSGDLHIFPTGTKIQPPKVHLIGGEMWLILQFKPSSF